MTSRQTLWKIATALSLLAAATFCCLWISHTVPAEDSADWVTAVATVAALLAAGGAAGAAFGQLRLLRLDAEERAMEGRIAQARGVYFISSPPTLTNPTGDLVLFNNSREPIDRVELHLRTPSGAFKFIVHTTVAPTGRNGLVITEAREWLVNRVEHWQLRKILDENGKQIGSWGEAPYEIGMIFRDSGGRLWLRIEGQGLTEVVGSLQNYLSYKPLKFGEA